MPRHEKSRARRLTGRLRRRLAPTPEPRPPAPHSSRLVEAAIAAGWPRNYATRSFLRSVGAGLAGRRPPRVAVLHGVEDHGLDLVILTVRPRAKVLNLDAHADPSELHVTMAAAGPFDLIVDDSREGRGRADLFERTFHHLRRRGSYVVNQFGAGGSRVGARRRARDAAEDTVLVAVTRLLQLRAEGNWRPRRRHGPAARDAARAVARAASIGQLTVDGTHLVVRCRAPALPKLRELETDGLLTLRSTLGRVINQKPPTRLVSRATVTESPRDASAAGDRPPEEYAVPAVSLREYHDAVCAPGQLLMSGGVLVSDSYRHHLRPNLKNRNTREVTGRFAVTRRPSTPTRDLAGAYFYLDSEFRGHFGHAMTEQLSRLWGWQEAKAAHPDLKALMSVTNWGSKVAEFERLLYGAVGIEPEDLVLFDEPVRVETLLAATPMFSQPTYVHPDLPTLWSEVGARLAKDAPERDYPKRIFCSRRGGHRACRNPEVLEQIFLDHGFTVIFPEDFTLSEQVRMFTEAEAIAGYAGSALFNICLTQTPKRVLMVSSESYTARNEYLMASAMGHHVDIVWSRPEEARTTGAWRDTPVAAGFTFDLDREGRFLRERLENLTPL